ncbi:hypothetical protein GCM10027421_00890 [Microbacterium shaanxiense]
MTTQRPVLALVTSIRHPHNSTDYASIESMLRESLTAWLGQSDARFVIVVVANRPVELPGDDRVHQVQVSFPPPSDARTARTGIAAVLRDKGTKNAVGLARAHRPATRAVAVPRRALSGRHESVALRQCAGRRGAPHQSRDRRRVRRAGDRLGALAGGTSGAPVGARRAGADADAAGPR